MADETKNRYTFAPRAPYGALALVLGEIDYLDDHFYWNREATNEHENPADLLLPYSITGEGREGSIKGERFLLPSSDPEIREEQELSIHRATFLTIASSISSTASMEVCRYLIERRKASVSARPGAGGATPLHMAAANGNAPLLEYLLQHLDRKEALNWGDGYTWEYLLLSRQENARLCGANRDNGYTALERALMGGHDDCARLLLEAGASAWPENFDNCNTSPLHYAAMCCTAETMQLLLEHGASYEEPCLGMGTHPILGYVVYSGDPKKIEVLHTENTKTLDDDPAWADVSAIRLAIMLNRIDVVRKLAELKCCDLQKIHTGRLTKDDLFLFRHTCGYCPVPFFGKYRGKGTGSPEEKVIKAWEAEHDAPEPNLLLAIRKGFWEVVSILLEHGVPLMTIHPRTGDGPLHCIGFKNPERAIEVAEEILRKEPRLLAIKNKACRSPLTESAYRIAEELKKRDELIQAASSPREKKKHRKKFADIFAKYGQWREFLINRGFREDEADCEGKTAAEYHAAAAKRVNQ